MAQLIDMVLECGKSYVPGTETDLYYQSSCKANYPDVGEDMVTLPSAPTFDQANWLRTKILIDSGGVDWNVIGEVGGQGIQSSLKFFVIGDDAEQLSFAARLVANSGNLTMGLRRRTGKNRVVGTNKLPAYVEELTGTSQIKLGEGKVGTAYKVTYPGPPLEFDGDFVIA